MSKPVRSTKRLYEFLSLMLLSLLLCGSALSEEVQFNDKLFLEYYNQSERMINTKDDRPLFAIKERSDGVYVVSEVALLDNNGNMLWRTKLPNELIANMTFSFTETDDGFFAYSVFSSSSLERQDELFLFTKQAGFDAHAGQIIDELFFVDNHLCCIGENENGNSFIGRIDGRQLITEAVLNERLRLVNHDAGLICFFAENKPGTNYRMMMIQDNNYQLFLTYFDHAQ